MSPTNASPPPEGDDFHIVAPVDHAGLTCRFLKPLDFNIADPAPSEPNFAASAQFLPLAVAVSPYGTMGFSPAARPSFDDDAVFI